MKSKIGILQIDTKTGEEKYVYMEKPWYKKVGEFFAKNWDKILGGLVAAGITYIVYKNGQKEYEYITKTSDNISKSWDKELKDMKDDRIFNIVATDTNSNSYLLQTCSGFVVRNNYGFANESELSRFDNDMKEN